MTWKNGEYQPKQKRGEEKKGRILDAALDLFSRKGFHGTNAKEIAALAGVATGTFYRYFRDKKALFLAVCARNEVELMGRILALGNRLRSQGTDEREVLSTLVRTAVDGHRQNTGLHREVLAMQLIDQDVAREVKQRETRIRRAITEFLQPKQEALRVTDLEAAMEMMLQAVEAASHQAIIFGSDVGEERLVRELTDMLGRYLFKDEPPDSVEDQLPSAGKRHDGKTFEA